MSRADRGFDAVAPWCAVSGEHHVGVEGGQCVERSQGLAAVMGGGRRDDPRPPAPGVRVEGDQRIAGEHGRAVRQQNHAFAVGVARRMDDLGLARQLGNVPVGSSWSGVTPGTRSAPAATMVVSTGSARG